MRGEVLYYDETQGFGFIHGADGNRYTFAAEDLRRLMPMEKGTVVEFQPNGDKARAIFTIRASAAGEAAATAPWQPGPAPAGPTTATSAAPHFGRLANADVDRPHSTGLWAYFRRGLIENYATFGSRARRKEYWAFHLFWFLAVLALSFVGLMADNATGNLDGSNGPVLAIVAVGLFMLATLLPVLAVTVRRIHDIGLPGWLCLLLLVPYVGGLIILVFALIPSQRQENRWGPVPDGIRL